MLDSSRCHHHITDRHRGIARTSHTQVENPLRLIMQYHALGAQGGIHLARAAHSQNSLLAKELTADKYIHADFLLLAIFQLRHQRLDLHRHGSDQSVHSVPPKDIGIHHYYTFFIPFRQCKFAGYDEFLLCMLHKKEGFHVLAAACPAGGICAATACHP